jgi:gluconokinase
LTDGGSAIEWARNLLNLQTEDDFDAALVEVSERYFNNFYELELDSPLARSQHVGTVTMIPFLSGERSVGFRDAATACISGITRDTTATDILHGCLQGVTLRLGAVSSLIKDVRCKADDAGDCGQTRLVVSGTALERNSLWRQMIADCTGFDVVVDGDSSGGTSRGVAMLIAKSIHLTEHCEEALSIVSQCQPNENARPRWRIAARDQENLITAVSETWDVE